MSHRLPCKVLRLPKLERIRETGTRIRTRTRARKSSWNLPAKKMKTRALQHQILVLNRNQHNRSLDMTTTMAKIMKTKRISKKLVGLQMQSTKSRKLRAAIMMNQVSTFCLTIRAFTILTALSSILKVLISLVVTMTIMATIIQARAINTSSLSTMQETSDMTIRIRGKAKTTIIRVERNPRKNTKKTMR